METHEPKGLIFIDFDQTLIDEGVHEISETIEEEEFINLYYRERTDFSKMDMFKSIIQSLSSLKEDGYILYVLSANENKELKTVIPRIYVHNDEPLFKNVFLSDDLENVNFKIELGFSRTDRIKSGYKHTSYKKSALIKKILDNRKINVILVDDDKQNIEIFTEYLTSPLSKTYSNTKEKLSDVLNELLENLNKKSLSEVKGESTPGFDSTPNRFFSPTEITPPTKIKGTKLFDTGKSRKSKSRKSVKRKSKRRRSVKRKSKSRKSKRRRSKRRRSM